MLNEKGKKMGDIYARKNMLTETVSMVTWGNHESND